MVPDPLSNAKRGKGLVKWGGCTVPDLQIPGENEVLIVTPNYNKTWIRSVALIALLSKFAFILENEAEKKLSDLGWSIGDP